MLDILYKNNQLIAVNKPAGIPVQADKSGTPSLQQLVEAYCHHPVHMVNRLDRPVSGVVLFAKSASAMTTLTRQFRERKVEKTYLALVQQAPPAPEGVLVHYLKKNEAKNRTEVFVEEKAGTEHAELHYKVLGSSDKYHLLRIDLHTGRHHQVRAQLAALGCPIRGDVKYGFRRSTPDRSIGLHAWRLAFNHPVSGERVVLEAQLPEDNLWKAFAGEVEAP